MVWLLVKWPSRAFFGNNLYDGQAEFLRKVPIALVVSRNGHDRASSIRNKDIVRNPDRDFAPIHGVYGVGAGKDTGLVLGKIRALEVALSGGFFHVIVDFFPLFRCRDCVYKRMFRRKDHVGRTKKRVWPRRVYLERFCVPLDGKNHRSAFGFANPVALHQFNRLGPVQIVESVKKPVGVIGYFEHPLADAFARHFGVAAVAKPVLDFLVGKACLAGGAPVDGHLCFVGKPFLIELKENPLGPFVVVGVAG